MAMGVGVGGKLMALDPCCPRYLRWFGFTGVENEGASRGDVSSRDWV